MPKLPQMVQLAVPGLPHMRQHGLDAYLAGNLNLLKRRTLETADRSGRKLA